VNTKFRAGGRPVGLNKPAILCVIALSLGGLSCPAFAVQTNRPLVLAFYHPWYGTPAGSAKQWYKWDSFRFPDRYKPERILPNGRRDIASADYPLIGPYDQGDREVVRWHFRLAKAAGIDGFLCSWWKFHPSRSHWDEWQTDLFEKVLLPVAREEDFKIAVADECAHYVRSYDQLLWRVTNNLPRLARHPAYLKINNQSAWFIYQVWDDWLTAGQAGSYVAEAEKVTGDVFWIFDKLKAIRTATDARAKMLVQPDWLQLPRIDCFGTYSYFGHWRDVREKTITTLYSDFVRDVRQAGKLAALPVSPGHDNTPVNAEPCIIPRENGATLKSFLRAVHAAKPEIVLVCSWNEWLETTQIEPSATWHDPYLYLKTLASWRGKEWRQPPMPK